MKFSIYIDDDEYEVEGTYTPGDPGQTSGPPENCWPPEDSEFEIDSIKIDGAELTGASEHLLGRIQQLAEEKADELYYDSCQDAQDGPEREYE
jgi:hypothetical protein